MIIPTRLAKRIEEVGISYTALAKKLGVKQPTITRLVKGEQRSTARIDLLASALETTPAYLCGETDDPETNAPSAFPPLIEHHVLMRVALPSERALAQMFEGMLEIMEEYPERPDLEETARLLAHWLPTGLSQLHDLLPDAVFAPAPVISKKPAEALATSDRGSRS